MTPAKAKQKDATIPESWESEVTPGIGQSLCQCRIPPYSRCPTACSKGILNPRPLVLFFVLSPSFRLYSPGSPLPWSAECWAYTCLCVSDQNNPRYLEKTVFSERYSTNFSNSPEWDTTLCTQKSTQLAVMMDRHVMSCKTTKLDLLTSASQFKEQTGSYCICIGSLFVLS